MEEERKARVKEIFYDYAGAGGAFATPAWIGSVPMEIVASVYAFLLVACVSSVLFDQLSGMRGLAKVPLHKTTNFVGSVTLGGAIGAASVYAEEYVAYFSLTHAALAGVCIPLIRAAWRQRWNERQLYRDTLLEAEPEPELLDSA